MRRRYEAELLMPGREGHILTTVARRRFSTAERAVRQCERWLAQHPVRTTRGNYWRDTGRAWCCRVADIGKDSSGRILARDAYADASRLEAPVTVLQSVGERGYW